MSNEPCPVAKRYTSCGWSRAAQPVHVGHRLPVGAAGVVLADQEQHGRLHVVRGVDRVPVGHQLGHLVRSSAQQRAVVRLEQRRHVLVGELVVADRHAGDAAAPVPFGMLPQHHQREVAAPRPTADGRAFRIRDPRRDQVVERVVEVLQLGPADVAHEGVTPLRAATGRAPVVDEHDGESGVDVGLNLGMPLVLVEPGRPPVRTNQDRPRSAPRRRHEEPLHRLTVSIVESQQLERPAGRCRLALEREHLPACLVEDPRGPRRRSSDGTRRRRPAVPAPTRPVPRDARSASSVPAASSNRWSRCRPSRSCESRSAVASGHQSAIETSPSTLGHDLRPLARSRDPTARAAGYPSRS